MSAQYVSDHIELKKALVLCNACATYRMPGNWLSKYDYYYLPGCRAQGECDYCRQRCNCGVYVREEGHMAQQSIRRERAIGAVNKHGRDSGIVIV